VIVRRWLCELARTRDVAASHVEPIPLHPPLRNLRHGWPPFYQENGSVSGLRPIGRCQRGSHDHTASSTASHGFVCIIVAYCPHAYASETMPSSLYPAEISIA